MQAQELRTRLERDARRSAVRDVSSARAVRRDGGEVGKVVVFCLDASGRVLASTELSFSSRDDLARQLGPDIERYPLVEAWQGSVCLFRQGGPAVPEWNDDD